jgi:hypothetical protein
MNDITDLAHATINGDELTLKLIRPEDMPAVVRIAWPLAPTLVDPNRFPDTAATLTKLFAEAAITLASIKANRRL